MSGPRRQLSMFDAICIIVGIIIGSSIYKTTPFIASLVGSPASLIGAWLLGGVIAILGALCYAELTTTYPEDGGDYVFLTRAFGRRTGFLFAWAEYWIVRPGNVGMMAFVFATFAQKLVPLQIGNNEYVGQAIYATSAIAILTVLNVLGVRTGKLTQNLLSTAKVLGLVVVIFVGLFVAPAMSVESAEVPPTASAGNVDTSVPSTDFRLAMIMVLFAYGGWNEVSYVAAELRHPERDLYRALLIGIAVVTTVYVMVNLAFLRVLGLSGIADSNAVAADVVIPTFGDWGGRLISVLVCVSALGAINGMLFTGARIYYVVGKEHALVRWLGRWSGQLDSPVRSLGLQAFITIALVIGFGWYQSGFERLFNFTAPVYWFFAFMVGVSLLVLRASEPNRRRPHPVLGYPWIPLFFCLTCSVLCESSFLYALSQGGGEAYWAGGLMLAGIAVTLLFDGDKANQATS
jgi:APA family basic amino acid/polyamine antiporter